MKTLSRIEIKNNAKYLDEVQAIHNSCASTGEQPIFVDQLFRTAKKIPIKQYAYFMGKKLVATLTEYKFGSYVELCNFGVKKELRNKGIGSLVMKDFIKRHKNKNIIFDVEAPDIETKEYKENLRRIVFYQRLGFYVLPYVVNLKNRVITFMSNKKSLDPFKFWWKIDAFWRYCYKQRPENIKNKK